METKQNNLEDGSSITPEDLVSLYSSIIDKAASSSDVEDLRESLIQVLHVLKKEAQANVYKL